MNRKNAKFINSPCHNGPIEVIEHLFCAGEMELLEMETGLAQIDTLIPLNSMNAAIWSFGFRGEVLYYPIEDYGTLPTDVLEGLVSNILDKLRHNKKVCVFCMGGHGRTGYVASVVLGKLGYDDPIEFLRSKYCRLAVESNAQIKNIAEVLGKPELVERYCFHRNRIIDNLDYVGTEFYDQYRSAFSRISTRRDKATCGDCVRNVSGYCNKNNDFVEEDDFACGSFIGELF